MQETIETWLFQDSTAVARLKSAFKSAYRAFKQSEDPSYTIHQRRGEWVTHLRRALSRLTLPDKHLQELRRIMCHVTYWYDVAVPAQTRYVYKPHLILEQIMEQCRRELSEESDGLDTLESILAKLKFCVADASNVSETLRREAATTIETLNRL
jgi:hypothetical protein